MPLYLNFKNIVLEKGLLAKYNHYFDVFQTKAQPNFVMKIIKKVYYFPLCLPSFYLSLSIYIHMCVYIYRRRQWHPTPVLLPGKSHGRRSLEGCSSWGRWGSDTTEQLHFHFSLSLSCIGVGNGNPLQRSCLENPSDGGAWWAAVCGVAQSQTRLKWLSSIYIYTHIYIHMYV